MPKLQCFNGTFSTSGVCVCVCVCVGYLRRPVPEPVPGHGSGRSPRPLGSRGARVARRAAPSGRERFLILSPLSSLIPDNPELGKRGSGGSLEISFSAECVSAGTGDQGRTRSEAGCTPGAPCGKCVMRQDASDVSGRECVMLPGAHWVRYADTH